MKKIFFILCFLGSLLSVSGAFAEECGQSCKIQDGPAPALTEYFTNIESLTQNIIKGLSEAESKKVGEEEEKKKVLGAFNALLSFKNHFGTFDFKISLPITNEVPEVVKRDHQKLEQITQKLTKILETAEKRGKAGAGVEDICTGVAHCTLGKKSAIRYYLVEVIKNNDRISELYRASIMDKSFLSDAEVPFILVSNDFRKQIEEYYNKDTLMSCSSCKGEFRDRVSEGIKNISFKTSAAKEGIKAWKDAWTLMKGGKAKPGTAAQEEVLLAGYLQQQGIQTQQAGIVSDNLNRYNSGGLSSSNPLFNSANYAQVQIQNQTKTFAQAMEEKLAGKEKVPNVELVRVDKQLKDTQDIAQSIASIYEDQVPFSLTQDTGAQQLQARIIRMHFSLIRSINILDGQIEAVQKLCDKQATGKGNCTNY